MIWEQTCFKKLSSLDCRLWPSGCLTHLLSSSLVMGVCNGRQSVCGREKESGRQSGVQKEIYIIHVKVIFHLKGKFNTIICTICQNNPPAKWYGIIKPEQQAVSTHSLTQAHTHRHRERERETPTHTELKSDKLIELRAACSGNAFICCKYVSYNILYIPSDYTECLRMKMLVKAMLK